MASSQYSYIDLTALDVVRARFAAGDAMAILTPQLDDVIWANGAGASLFGYGDIASIIGSDPRIGIAARRQITSTPGYPRIGKERTITVRLASGMTSRAVSFVASELRLPGGEDAILLAVPAPAAAWRRPAETAASAIAGLGGDGQHAAIVDASGEVLASSAGFDRLQLDRSLFAELAGEARSERLVKRMIESPEAYLPAGFVRLVDDPALYLLVVVDEAAPEEAEAASRSASSGRGEPLANDAGGEPVGSHVETGADPSAGSAGMGQGAEAPTPPHGDADAAEEPGVGLSASGEDERASRGDAGIEEMGTRDEPDPVADSPMQSERSVDETLVEERDSAAETGPGGLPDAADADAVVPAFAEADLEPAELVAREGAEPPVQPVRDGESAEPTPAPHGEAQPPAGSEASDADVPAAAESAAAEIAVEQHDDDAVAAHTGEDNVAPGEPYAEATAAGPRPAEEVSVTDAADAVSPDAGAAPAAEFVEPHVAAAAEALPVADDHAADADAGRSPDGLPDHPGETAERDGEDIAAAAAGLPAEGGDVEIAEHAALSPSADVPSAGPDEPVARADAAPAADAAEGTRTGEVDQASSEGAATAPETGPAGGPVPVGQDEASTSGGADADRPAAGEEPAGTELQPAMEADHSAAPVRFVWKTDADGCFSEISEAFTAAVRTAPAQLLGVSFREVAGRFGMDPGGEIAGLLERRDTWSGRSVMWPVAGTDLRIPVDLAALPAYDRDRRFAGFRGFGVARTADAVVDPSVPAFDEAWSAEGEPEPPAELPETASPPSAPEASSAEDAAAEATGPTSVDPFLGEVPALSIASPHERRHSDKVIRLAEHRANGVDKGLSTGERNAFREIGDRLKRESGLPEDDGEAAAVAVARDAAGSAVPGAEARQDEAGAGEPDRAPLAADTQDQIVAGPLEGPGAEEAADRSLDGDTIPPAADADRAEAEDRSEPAPAASEREEPETAPSGHVEAAEIASQPAGLSGSDAAEDAGAAVGQPEGAGGEMSEAVEEPASPDYLPSAFASRPQRERVPVDTSILDQLPIPVLIHSGDTLHYANRQFLEFTGYDSVEELETAGGLGSLFGEPYPADEGQADAGRKLRLRTSEGLEYPVEAFLQSVPWGSGKALLLSLLRSWRQPVSYPAQPVQPPAAQPSDSELGERVAEMRAIVDTATDGVVLIARDGTIRSISRPAEALFGFESADVVGKPFASLFAVESQRAARDYLNGLSENGVASVLNDGREVIGREAQGRYIPLFMTIGRLPNESGFCAVLRDITQWKRAEEDLTQARAQAERASSQKTDFLARVSHEIRTPLNAIIGFSELMLDEKFGPVGNDRYRDYLRDINRSGNHVLDLVNDLLDISKIEAGQQEMSYEAVSLNDTLAETVAMMQPQANRERVIIRSSFASRLPEVVADLRSVRQIALNLLSNAIRYTPAGGQVIVSTAYEGSGDVVMRVRDTGIGMSQPEIEQALKPFKQINALKRARGDGTGLGLPLTKALVEANRARFIITSTPGEGTLVEITFPSTRVLAD